MLELLARDQFINALPEEEMRLRTRQSRSGSLREALKVALELESYQLASCQRQRVVRATRTMSPGTDAEPPAISDSRPPWVDEQLCCIRQTQPEVTNAKAHARTRRRPAGGDKKDATCWRCGEPGHLRRNFKAPVSSNPAEPQGNGK